MYKKNEKPDRLRGRHFVYDLVEDTTIKKKPNLEVVLTSFVEGIGSKGDVVSLKPNIAYNKLLLPGLAVYKTPEAITKYATLKEQKETQLHSSAYAQRVSKKNGATFNANLFSFSIKTLIIKKILFE